MVLIPHSIQNVHSPAGTGPLPSHLTSCTPTKSNLYLDSSLETVIREPTLYKLLIFHVPNLMSPTAVYSPEMFISISDTNFPSRQCEPRGLVPFDVVHKQ
jgi:hypothetical protein